MVFNTLLAFNTKCCQLTHLNETMIIIRVKVMATNKATITPTAIPTPLLLILVELLVGGGSVIDMSKTNI